VRKNAYVCAALFPLFAKTKGGFWKCNAHYNGLSRVLYLVLNNRRGSVKLAIAFVAALSLVGCATDEPNDPGEGLYGVGIGKAIATEPGDIRPADSNSFAALGRQGKLSMETMVEIGWVETLPPHFPVDAPAQMSGVHVPTGHNWGLDDVYVFDDQGVYVCHAQMNGHTVISSDCSNWLR
jgi:hypothetical protein